MISMMKKMRRCVIAALLCGSMAFSGCSSIGQTAGAKADGKHAAPAATRIPLRVGETIRVTLVPPSRVNTASQATEQKVTVKEDGSIALPNFPTIPAAGKTCKELEETIHNLYVPDFWTSLGVTVEPDARFFYVGGEVNMPKRHEYFAGLTVTRAIQASQGFTEYANKKKIKLIHTNGKIEKINWNDAIDNPQKDPAVYPGDTVDVPRRSF
jgi:polysaccharide export outer membrane protein